jgi:phosphatidylserine decarboxylase
MFGGTQRRLFWKSHSNKHWGSPLRRWYYHRAFVLGAAGTAAAIGGSYSYAALAPAGSDSFASGPMQSVVFTLPGNLYSRLWGLLAANEALPPGTQAALIRAYAWATGAALTADERPLCEYPTLQAFHSRARTAASATPAPRSAAVVVAPCDCVVSAAGPLVRGAVLQVKGESLAAANLLRHDLAPVADEHERFFVSMHLPAGGYHRFHAPADMSVAATVQVPGQLLPISAASLRWLPNLFVSNERVSILGSSAAVSGGGVMHMACVGGLCSGNIAINFDQRIRTNLADPLETAVTRMYKGSEPHVSRGVEMGRFDWGSAIVLIFDLPKLSGGMKLAVSAGDVLHLGQAITSLA